MMQYRNTIRKMSLSSCVMINCIWETYLTMHVKLDSIVKASMYVSSRISYQYPMEYQPFFNVICMDSKQCFDSIQLCEFSTRILQKHIAKPFS